MKINAIHNHSTSFGNVRNVRYPKYYDAKMRQDLQFKTLDEMKQHLEIVTEFDKRMADLKAMTTNLKDILEYDQLKDDDKKYADALVKRISDKEKEALTIDMSMSNNDREIGSTFSHGYLAIDYPTLVEEWKNLPESYMDPKISITYHLTKGECKLEDALTFFYGRLPVPKPNYLKERIKENLLHEGKEFYEYDQRHS